MHWPLPSSMVDIIFGSHISKLANFLKDPIKKYCFPCMFREQHQNMRQLLIMGYRTISQHARCMECKKLAWPHSKNICPYNTLCVPKLLYVLCREFKSRVQFMCITLPNSTKYILFCYIHTKKLPYQLYIQSMKLHLVLIIPYRGDNKNKSERFMGA
jgi:hypothetical protein